MCDGETLDGSLSSSLSHSVFDFPVASLPPTTHLPPHILQGLGPPRVQDRDPVFQGRVAGVVKRAGQRRGGAGQGRFRHLEVEEQEESCPEELKVPWIPQLSPQLQEGTGMVLFPVTQAPL